MNTRYWLGLGFLAAGSLPLLHADWSYWAAWLLAYWGGLLIRGSREVGRG